MKNLIVLLFVFLAACSNNITGIYESENAKTACGQVDVEEYILQAGHLKMSSHAGWSEVTAYSEGVRQTLTLGSVSGQSVDNSASNAQFSINASATIAGGFIATDDTKGGSSGTLFGAADFTSPRSMSDGDTLNIEITITAASA